MESIWKKAVQLLRDCKIPDEFNHPDTLTKQIREPNEKTETTKYPIPSKEGLHFNFSRSAGLCYELACVRECLNKGLTECPDVPLDESIIIAEVLEEIRLQLGVKYPQTKKDDDKKDWACSSPRFAILHWNIYHWIDF